MYILSCSIVLLQLTITLNGNDKIKFTRSPKKASSSAPKSLNMQKRATNSSMDKATKNKIEYFFNNSAVSLNGPMNED